VIDVERGPRPASLDRGADDPAFRDHLHQVFHGKCYLTEQLLPRSELQVDHAAPRSSGGDDAAAANTAALLGKLHHGTNAHRYSDDLRDAIDRRLRGVYEAMVRFWQTTDPAERVVQAAAVRRMVDRDGPFHALLMSVPAVRQFLRDAG
jgi:hypothetical protein